MSIQKPTDEEIELLRGMVDKLKVIIGKMKPWEIDNVLRLEIDRIQGVKPPETHHEIPYYCYPELSATGEDY